MDKIPYRPDAVKKSLGTSNLTSIRYTIYGDAAGSDDWTSGDGPWYVFSWALVRGSHRWKRYKNYHKTTCGGHIHMSGKFPGGAGERDGIALDVFNNEPYDMAFVFLVNKRKYSASLISHLGAPPHPHAIRERLWQRLAVVLAAPVLLLNKMAGIKGPGVSPFKSFVYNNAADGKSTEKRIISGVEHLWGKGVPCVFRPGGDPGVDLADILSWSFRRIATGHPANHLPWGLHDGFGKRVTAFLIENDDNDMNKKPSQIMSIDHLQRISRDVD